MQNQLLRIKQKLTELKRLDAKCSNFGTSHHQYNLNPVVTLQEIQAFEAQHQIQLPQAYVLFLTELGNGGAGPYYGLEPLNNTLFVDLDYPDEEYLLNPSEPFPHTTPWNLDFDEDFKPTVTEEEDEDEYERQHELFCDIYYDFKQMNGTLTLCNYGCGITIRVVVNGAEYGYLWTDDRGNDGGIYPSFELGNTEKITFLDWYELWLDTSLKTIE